MFSVDVNNLAIDLERDEVATSEALVFEVQLPNGLAAIPLEPVVLSPETDVEATATAGAYHLSATIFANRILDIPV